MGRRKTATTGSKLLLSVFFLLIFTLSVTAAEFDSLIEEADAAYEADEYRTAIDTLKRALEEASGADQRAEAYWRLSRAELGIGDVLRDREAADDRILARFEQGESYGQKAIEADPQDHRGYYWKASNIGRWGQTKGVLNSLFRASEMRDLLEQAVQREPEHSDSYYVLGQLYAKVPSFLSFGNISYAVSLARKSVRLHEAARERDPNEDPEFDFYVQLASHLSERGWSEGKRERRHDRLADEHERASGVVEQSLYYEGSVSIPSMSDAAEARSILESVIPRLERVEDPGASERRQLERARELRADL
jgi:tetratricopeptide (TPR) repeat protein